MPRTDARPARALLVAAASLTLARRSQLRTGVRSHVQRLQRVSPIEHFAPGGGNRALLDRDAGCFGVRIIAQRDARSGRLLFVPVDERVIAGWLA